MKIKTNNTNSKPFVFVLMPFHSDFDDIYQMGIKETCVSAGAYCERVDEQIFIENILERVYNQIAKADIVVSEMTGRNPNVFYETGYAHALNKRVILLTQNADDIPFDLKHYPHIIYGGKITRLKTELEKKIKWCIDNPTVPITKVDFNFELTINNLVWQEGLQVPIPYASRLEFASSTITRSSPDELFTFPLHFGLHNTTNTVIDSSSYHLSLIIPEVFSIKSTISGTNAVIHNGQYKIIKFPTRDKLFPDDWTSADVSLTIARKEIAVMDLPCQSEEFMLRVFSDIGSKDYRFVLEISRDNKVKMK